MAESSLSCASSAEANSRHMKHKAGNLGVDLLLVDTGNMEMTLDPINYSSRFADYETRRFA